MKGIDFRAVCCMVLPAMVLPAENQVYACAAVTSGPDRPGEEKFIEEREDTVLRDSLRLDEAVVTALKVSTKRSETPSCIEIVNSEIAEKTSSATIADALKNEPGLSKGGDGIWATNINVRGFGENRLVTLVDRNRVETATDLTASLSMFDIADIERIEVIKGAQSSIYGSGAIGGIINVVTKDGHFAPKPYFNGSVSARWSSANNGHEEYLTLYGGSDKWYIKANGSFSEAGDIRTPEGYLKNSAYKSCNAGASAAYKAGRNQTLKAQFQYNRSWDVGIPGGASFSPQASAKYKNIDRTMASLNYEITCLASFLTKLEFKAWFQGIRRDVEMQPNAARPSEGAMPTLVTPNARHNSFGFNAESKWNFGDWNSLTAGVEMWQRRITSDRNKYIDQYSAGKLSAQLIRNEKPLPEASHTSSGIYAQDDMHFLDKRLILSLGFRADINAVRNEECHNVESITNVTTGKVNPDPPGKHITFTAGKRLDPSWSANAGLLFKAGRKCDLVFNISRSYRSPALEEMFKFIDLTGNRIHFGNPSLKAEKALGGDIGVRFHGNKVRFRFSSYINGIRDMIVERKTNVNPESVNDTLVLNNAARALLFGFDAGIDYEIIRGLSLYASAAWTVGKEMTQNNSGKYHTAQWLPGIPPLNGRVGISYENCDILGADLSVTASDARREGQIAEGERPTEAWYRLDFSIHSKKFEFGRCKLQLFGGIDNITDVRYTNFLSTNRGNIICEPGRNFFVRAVFAF